VFEFKKEAFPPIFPHNTVSGLVVRDVLAVLWQDKTLVRFLTTIHTLTSPNDYLLVDRNRPPLSGAANEQLVRQGWGDQPFVAQQNPRVAVKYTLQMGSVDQDNQLRAEHACKLRSHRNWLPLLLWLLDISTDNAWLLTRQFGTLSLNHLHRDWLHQLSWDLVVAGRQQLQVEAAAAAVAAAAEVEHAPVTSSPPPPPPDTNPNHRTRFKPQHKSQKNRAGRCPYVTKFRGRVPIFPHKTVSGLVGRDVLAVLWQDRKLVRFLTTIHTLTSSNDYLLVDRNRPHVTDTNRELVWQGWGDQPTVAQRNPLVAIQYNQFMGSVDQDNQLRAEHACTLCSHRNWLSLFFWMLDISTDNAWLLARQFGTASLNQNHHNWLLRLSREVVNLLRMLLEGVPRAAVRVVRSAGVTGTPGHAQKGPDRGTSENW
jgi:hypothetical protein